nr:unnamed protein product [Spirometra erinaceieuropaei]
MDTSEPRRKMAEPTGHEESGPVTSNIQDQALHQLLRRVLFIIRLVRFLGFTFCAIATAGFAVGVIFMALDFDGTDEEYYEEEGEMKTRMGLFDYGVISLGLAVIFTILSAVLFGLVYFCPLLRRRTHNQGMFVTSASATMPPPVDQAQTVPTTSPPPYNP